MTVLHEPAPMSATTPHEIVWQRVCLLDDLLPERGAAALLTDPADGSALQVALVRLHDGRVLAVDNHDPFGDAYVLSRGIVGWRRSGDETIPTIASPLHKQVFSLETGRCLDTAGKTPHDGLSPDLRAFPVRVVPDGAGAVVEVGLPGKVGG